MVTTTNYKNVSIASKENISRVVMKPVIRCSFLSAMIDRKLPFPNHVTLPRKLHV